MPRCFGASGSVRASSAPNWARSACEVQILCPLISHPPSTLTARVTSEARSEPAPGSLNNWHHRWVPRRIGHGEPLALQIGPAVENRRQDPFGDTERRPGHVGTLVELLGDDHLLHRRGAEAPRRGQMRGDQTRVGQQVSLCPEGQAGRAWVVRRVLVAQRQRPVEGGRDAGPGTRIRHRPDLLRWNASACGPARRPRGSIASSSPATLPG